MERAVSGDYCGKEKGKETRKASDITRHRGDEKTVETPMDPRNGGDTIGGGLLGFPSPWSQGPNGSAKDHTPTQTGMAGH